MLMLTSPHSPATSPQKTMAQSNSNQAQLTPRQERRLARLARRQARPWWLNALILLVELLLIGVFCVLAAGLGGYWYFSRNLPSIDNLGTHRAFETTKLYARDGTTLLYEIFDPNAGQRTVVPFSAFSEYLKQATIAVEDSNFYTNPGVNLPSIARAALANLTDQESGQGGASTITQQLVRNVLLSPDERSQQTPQRKIREAILAYQISQRYSKDQILALYLNEIPYGNNAYGAEAAAQAYFGVSVSDLSLAQSAMLAGLPQSPSQLDPLVNADAAKKRQEIVLAAMVRNGVITPQQAEQAFAEVLYVKPAQVNLTAPHFVFYVRELLEARYGPELLYRGGLRVTTTLDPHWQAVAQQEVQQRISEIAAQNATNGSVVMLDRKTNQVLALVGSADYNNTAIDGQVNVALAERQPGSALKPFVYAAAMLRDWTAASVLWDVPTEYRFAGGEVYAPKNYDRSFHGPVSIRVALANSFNVPAVKTLDHVGIDEFLRLMQRVGISTLDDRPRYGLSLALGGGEVKLLELTTAYSVFANEGNYRPASTILKVVNTRGEVLEAWSEPPKQAVLGPDGNGLAFIISSMLSDNKAREWMFGPDNAMELPNDRPAAVKTGTTDDDRDSWTVGYTPSVVIGAWVGNSDNSPMQAVPGSFGAAVIWNRLMTKYHEGLPIEQFTPPSNVSEHEVCIPTGTKPSAACPNIRTEYFVNGTEPVETENVYRTVRIGPSGDCVALPNQPGEDRVFAIYPDEAGNWGETGGLGTPPTKPCPLVNSSSAGGANVAIALIEPSDGAALASPIRIRGSAAGDYSVAWGTGTNPSSWTTIIEGFGGISNGLLAMWNADGLPEGAYSLRLLVKQSNGMNEQRVTIYLDRTAPTISINVPASALRGQPLQFQATAQDDRQMAKVEWTVNGEVFMRDQAPYSLDFSPTQAGTYRVVATAIDQAGNRATSSVSVLSVK